MKATLRANSNALSTLLADVWDDWSRPGVTWQIGTLIVCCILGWLLSRALRAAYGKRTVNVRMMRLGVESFARVLTPLLILVLILMAKPVLAKFHSINLLRLALPLVASFALIRLVFYIVRRIFARGNAAGKALLLFEKIVAILVWLAVALYITGLWPDVIEFLDDTSMTIGHYKISLLSIAQASVSIAATLILALWIGALLAERVMHVTSMHFSLRTVVARLLRALLIVVAILVSLSMMGIDLTVLSVFGGALGVGIGLGLQKIVGSYISGFVILLERSLAIGDMVTVDKYYGRVTKINARYTLVRSLEGIEHVIPNDLLISSPIQNYSLSDRILRLSTQLTIHYDSDLESVLPLLEQAVTGIARVSKEVPPSAVFLKFGVDGLELEIGFWITDPENGRNNILSEVNRALWRTLQAHAIRIPYSQLEVQLIPATLTQVMPPRDAPG